MAIAQLFIDGWHALSWTELAALEALVLLVLYPFGLLTPLIGAVKQLFGGLIGEVFALGVDVAEMCSEEESDGNEFDF